MTWGRGSGGLSGALGSISVVTLLPEKRLSLGKGGNASPPRKRPKSMKPATCWHCWKASKVWLCPEKYPSGGAEAQLAVQQMLIPGSRADVTLSHGAAPMS